MLGFSVGIREPERLGLNTRSSSAETSRAVLSSWVIEVRPKLLEELPAAE